MFFIFIAILNFYFILCANAINFQVDGRIDFGKKWTYKYKIVIPESKETTIDILRHGPQQEMTDNVEISKNKNLPVQERFQDMSNLDIITATTHLKMQKGTDRENVEAIQEIATFESIVNKSKKHKSEHILNDSKNEDDVLVKRKKHGFKRRHKAKAIKTHGSHKKSIEGSVEGKDPKQHGKISRQIKKRKQASHETTTQNQLDKMASKFLNKSVLKANVKTHKIKYHTQVNYFTEHLLMSGIKVFENIKNKTTDPGLRDKLDMLATSYEQQYRKFLNETSRHNIKSRLGIQKVILNAIDVSDRILKRLVNYIVNEINQKGNLRIQNNLDITNNLIHEVFIENNEEHFRACKNFNICRTEAGFSEFLNEYLAIILRSDDLKLKQAIDSLTEVSKNINFNHILEKQTQDVLKHFIKRIERRDVNNLRPGLMILKNIIANKNKPIALPKSQLDSSFVNSTLALHEIIYVLDSNLPRNAMNMLIWSDLRGSLKDWADNKRFDVQKTMKLFMDYIVTAIENMPGTVQNNVAVNIERAIKH